MQAGETGPGWYTCMVLSYRCRPARAELNSTQRLSSNSRISQLIGGEHGCPSYQDSSVLSVTSCPLLYCLLASLPLVASSVLFTGPSCLLFTPSHPTPALSLSVCTHILLDVAPAEHDLVVVDEPNVLIHHIVKRGHALARLIDVEAHSLPGQQREEVQDTTAVWDRPRHVTHAIDSRGQTLTRAIQDNQLLQCLNCTMPDKRCVVNMLLCPQCNLRDGACQTGRHCGLLYNAL